MKITVLTKDLRRALRIVSTTCQESSKDNSSHVLFKIEDGGLTLNSSYSKIFSRANVSMEEECTEEFSFTVETKRLKNWLSVCDESTVSFTYDPSTLEVTASNAMGDVAFISKDPTSFPDWSYLWDDFMMEEVVSCDHLREAVKYIKNFIYTNDTTRPEFCVAESDQGYLYGTDLQSVVSVNIEGMTSSSLRIHNKTANPLVKFLDMNKATNVTIYGHPRAYLIMAEDGSLFGEMKVTKPYGGPKHNNVDAQQTISFSRESFNKAVKHLWSVADWSLDEISIENLGEELQIEVTSTGKKKYKTKIPMTSTKSKGGSDDFISGKIPISKSRMDKILAMYPEDEISIGLLSKNSRCGFLVFDYTLDGETEGDKYLNVVLCKR